MSNSKVPEWSVAIFSSREEVKELLKTLEATIQAVNRYSIIDILINGNILLANELCFLFKNNIIIFNSDKIRIRVWYIELGDKAHTYNQYIHSIWPKSTTAFFIDGYVRVNKDSFELIHQAIQASPTILAGTGVPTMGRSATVIRKSLINDGGIHGNLFALKKYTLFKLRKLKFKLPLGLYRTDPTLGAALAFDLDPKNNTWNCKERILAVPNATWSTNQQEVLNILAIYSQIKRIFRQGQGVLENLAVNNIYAQRKLPINSLPFSTSIMIFDWIDGNKSAFIKSLIKNPILIFLALNKLKKPNKWETARLPPVLAFDSLKSDKDKLD